MRLLMVAPPGAGKGTQAGRLAARYGIEHIASGDLLREEIATGSEIGLRANESVKRGDLVPDDIVLAMVVRRVLEASAANGYVLDGWPRNLAQAHAAYDLARQREGVGLQAVLNLEVGRDELVRRMVARGTTEGRDDDTQTTIAHRFDVFDSQTRPLLAYYAERGILHRIDGEQSPDAVTDAVVEVLERLGLT